MRDIIYRLCDRIIDNRVLNEEALIATLSGIASGYKTGKQRLDKRDKFEARAYAMNYRAKKVGAEGAVTADELRELWGEKPKCAKCGSDKNLVYDHIKPFYRGGTNKIDNLQILCSKCNMEKGVN